MPFKSKHLEYMKNWRKKNKERIAKYNKEVRYPRLQKKRVALKKMAITHLGGKCVKCGYKRNLVALEFHHKDPNKKENYDDMISTFIHNYSKKKLMNELKKCILVCSNCHKELHYPNSFF